MLERKILRNVADAIERHDSRVPCNGCSICVTSWIVAIGRVEKGFRSALNCGLGRCLCTMRSLGGSLRTL